MCMCLCECVCVCRESSICVCVWYKVNTFIVDIPQVNTSGEVSNIYLCSCKETSKVIFYFVFF